MHLLRGTVFRVAVLLGKTHHEGAHDVYMVGSKAFDDMANNYM